MGLLSYNFASDYIGTGKYTVRTGAGLTPFLEPGSGVPQRGTEDPFLYLLVTRPLALTIEQDYPAYAPYVISLERSLLSYPWRVVLFEPWSAGSKFFLQAESKKSEKGKSF